MNTELAVAGDKVKCIDVGPLENQVIGPRRLQLGNEYTVERVFEQLPRRMNYILKECPNGMLGYRAQRFELTSNPNY